MAKQVTLAARPRSGSGKGESRALRREGRVPAIAYGTDLAPTAISVDQLELYHALHGDAGANAVMRLNLDGEEHLALAREIQRDPIRRLVLHVDFVTVSRNVKVSVDVPIHLEGAENSPGVSDGGVLSQEMHALPLDVLPLEVPDSITVDVSQMEVGQTLRVSDLTVPDGVDVTADPDAAVASMVVPQLDVPAEPTEAEEAGEEAEGATAEAAGDESSEGGAGNDEG